MAAETQLPVVAVPIDSSVLKGLDALLATVQMPSGIPVATMAIGKAGARNAGLFALQILALENPVLAEKYAAFRTEMASAIETKSQAVQERLNQDLI
jgi:phosphoribosylaminoimidazole carboxylase PurE protein